MLTPWLTMEISRLCSFWNQSIISLSVGFWNSKRSQSVHSVLPYFFFGAAMGSEKPKKGKARLTKPFLYASSFRLPSMIYIAARQYPRL